MNNKKPLILLSFDIEEFDTPTEYGADIPEKIQMRVSEEGTTAILDILKNHNIPATFFCTANFAVHHPALMQRMKEEGHEIASHGYYHSSFENADLLKSRIKLEELCGVKIEGYRMARMMPVDEGEIRKAGYNYNSSLHPTCIPGRYNNLGKPRTLHEKEGVIQIPASVTPWLRIPLFWLAAHHFPFGLYKILASRTARHDGYLAIYFHPWEFTDLKHPEFRLPYLITHHSGKKMKEKLDKLILYFVKKGYRFGRMNQTEK